jgi:hypothetical protein
MISKFKQIIKKIHERYQCGGIHDWLPLEIPAGAGIKGSVDRCAICGCGRFLVPPALDTNGFLSPSVMAELRLNLANMRDYDCPPAPTKPAIRDYDCPPAPTKPAIRECEFVEASDIIPRHWQEWFWCMFSDNAPFSWGDNNRALVTASSFLEHCERSIADVGEDGVIPQEELDQFFKLLESLEDTYIDLEN